MLRTVLLLDGSDSMNNASDYLPNYLLAMRPPLLHFVDAYMNSTPLASLGAVVMRNGIAHRLLSCTTNHEDVMDVLERDYFLYGGSGATSVENGLRMAMTELVDARKLAAAKAGPSPALWRGTAAQLRVLLVSASVTLIDPTDVFRVIRTMAGLHIRIDVISLVGAVHVFETCSTLTGGTLACPLNYDHLTRIVEDMAVPHEEQRQVRPKGGASTTGGGVREAQQMISMGCPVHLDAADQEAGAEAPVVHLACPRCHFPQASVPSTCLMCRLLICSVPALYGTYAVHNDLVSPVCSLSPETGERGVERCALCMASVPRAAAVECEGCHVRRCAACQKTVTTMLHMCPTCVASQ